MSKSKPTALQSYIIKNISNGFPIICTFIDKKTAYSCAGRTVGERTIRSMLEKGLIKSNEDSLISDRPQTYGLAYVGE